MMKKLRKILVKIFPSLRRKTAEAKTTQTDCSTLELFFFLDEMILQKKEAIRQLEVDLECPICLEIVEGEIYSCVFQHFICSECRESLVLVECPQCREPYPPDLIRHRYVEKSVVQLESLREELKRIQKVLEQYDN